MRLLLPYLLALVLLVSATAAVAGESEYQVKAAMLYNIAKFVEWPADALGSDNRLTICVAGKSPFNTPIQQMQGKPVKGRAVAVRQIARPEDVAGCQLLFIPSSEGARLSAYLQHAGHVPTLTVSDLDHFTASGGMVGFYEEEKKIRFEINLEAAQKRHLQISSHLLNLARRTR